MELKATKKFVVDGVSFDTKTEANKAMKLSFLKEIIAKGSNEVIENATEVIKALNIVTRK
jgi:hypothetical protein